MSDYGKLIEMRRQLDAISDRLSASQREFDALKNQMQCAHQIIVLIDKIGYTDGMRELVEAYRKRFGA